MHPSPSPGWVEFTKPKSSHCLSIYTLSRLWVKPPGWVNYKMRKKKSFKGTSMKILPVEEKIRRCRHIWTRFRWVCTCTVYIPHLAPVQKCKDDIIVSSPPQLFPLWDAIRTRPPAPPVYSQGRLYSEFSKPNVVCQPIS
jgi:hypothetical protein